MAVYERLYQLSQREYDVLDLLAEGMTNPQIANALSIAERTAEHHVASILGKLEVSNRTQAAVRALQRGIVRNQRR